MSKEMTLQEKYNWVNKVAIKSLEHLKDSAFTVYVYSRENNAQLFNEICNPKIGDLVLEITSHVFKPSNWGNIGILKEIKSKTEFVIETLDGDTQSWTNTKFIKILTKHNTK